MPVHLAGTSCDMKEINKLAREYKFKVIEDASHAIGGMYNGNNIGCCEYSDICVFSLHPVKIITTGEGGIATTNKLNLAERMKELRAHGIVRDRNKFVNKEVSPWSYEQQELGYNYRMTDIQAALGISQLKRLESIVNERNKQLTRYRSNTKDLPIRFLDIPEGTKSSVHLAVVVLVGATPRKHLETFKLMREENIGVQLHYTPVHLQPYYRKMGFKEGDFKEAENYSKSAFSIPLFPGLTIQEQDQVIQTLRRIVKK